jgi:hypothetical protein
MDEVSRRPNLGRKILDHRTGNLMVFFLYALHFVERVKSTCAHRRNREGRYWSFANATGILERASKVCKGERISIDPGLQPLYSSHCDANPRKSQGVRLTSRGIDNERMLMHIRESKLRKDRSSMLSNIALGVLREYWKEYGPTEWLLPGPEKERHITKRTAQRIFEMACKRAGAKKEVTIHSLRHSFATHPLGNGIALMFSRTTCWHKSSRTTEIYTHLSSKDSMRMRNPLDQIWEEKKVVHLKAWIDHTVVNSVKKGIKSEIFVYE